MSADPLAIARDLLRCPSVTPAEGGALSFLEAALNPAKNNIQAFLEKSHGAIEILTSTIHATT